MAKSEAMTEAAKYAQEHGISKEEAFKELYARKRFEFFNDYYKFMYHLSNKPGSWDDTMEWAKKAGINYYVIHKLEEIRENFASEKDAVKSGLEVAIKPLETPAGAQTVVGMILDKINNLFHFQKEKH